MAAISQTIFSKIVIIISPRFIPKGLIDNISALIQINAWHPAGDKALSELMVA